MTRALEARPAACARTTVLVLVVALMLAWAAGRPGAAAAGGVGTWTNLTGATGTTTTQVTAVATPNGLLHVVWVSDAATPGLQNLMYRTVTATGSFGAKRTIQANWSVLNDPDILYDPSAAELGIVFSGMRSANLGEIYDGLTVSVSSNGGATWALDPYGVFDPPGSSAYSSPVSAIGAGGVQYSTWYGDDGVWVLRGVSGKAPAHNYQSGLGDFGQFSNFGLDKNGTLRLVWASNATGTSGLWTAAVNQTSGAPLGSPVALPGSTTKYGGTPQFDMELSRVAVTGRPQGGGVFVAYPTGYPTTNTVRLWKLSGSNITSSVIAGGSAGKSEAALAAGADGRLWVVWSQHAGERDRVYVRRSNTSATKFGPVKYYTTPASYPTVYHLAAIVRKGKLDVLAHLGGAKGESTWHIQFAPPT